MKEYDLSVNKELRETCMEQVDALEKVKKLFLIPGMEVMTTKQVAEYFQVDSETIQKVYQRNKAELDLAGATLKSLADFELDKAPVQSNKRGVTTFQISEGNYIEVSNRGVKCFTQKAILRIAMLLRDSEIAKEVREQLIADGAEAVAGFEEPKTDKFDLIKSLVNQKFGEVRVLVENDAVLFCGSDVAKR